MPSLLASRIVKSFDRTEFDQHLQDLETELERFKLRYHEFLADWEQYQHLQAQLQAAETPDPQSDSTSNPHSDPISESPLSQAPDLAAMSTAIEQTHTELLQQYDRLREDLQGIETRWEAQFFSWEGFGTVFWQVVRFLGLGILLGWWLRGCAG